eukprot:CAMPEP_0119472164 /NCGR_PEP_ID=MMETSP1344-20130328/4339_1 /TAXON_ID=236787 /ORGANISM="Florenciella parvula, Strain CCMP2471" /LENGTH=76 /DNA_ID=CAMNT_0007505069 /DNA_START=178 /DNA_END=404 /DNA_ORIENTATION=-
MSESQRREVPAVQNLSPAHSVLCCGCERRSIDGGGSRPSMPRRRDHSAWSALLPRAATSVHPYVGPPVRTSVGPSA